MTDMRRIILYVTAALLGALLYMTWQRDYPATNTPSPAKTTLASNQSSDYTPPAFAMDQAEAPKKNQPAPQSPKALGGDTAKGVTVSTQDLRLRFTRRGANLIQAELLQYNKSSQDKRPVQILHPSPDRLYVAQNGVTAKGLQTHQLLFGEPTLQRNDQQTVVTFRKQLKSGLVIEKRFVVPQQGYALKASTTLQNKSDQPWQGSFYHQIVRRNVKTESGGFHAQSYNEAAMYTPNKPYTKLPFKTLAEEPVDKTIKGGWIAMQQQYFLSTWVPNQQTTNHFYSHAVGHGKKGQGDLFTVGYVSPQATVAPGQSLTNTSHFYVGPEIADNLAALAPGLKLTIDYGWLWWLSTPIFWVMKHIHAVVGNWGWTIVAITVLIKLIFFHLSNKSYRSMAKMRDLQPRIEAMRKRYGDDKQALGRATMEFYKKEKVNPLGGCLPMLVQIPVFIALYFVLIEAVQLRQAPFIFWIQDLSTKDPYYVLPVLMGLSMFVQQKLSPPPPDPTQAKVMLLLPVALTVFFFSFPAGLVLYWLVNNCLSIAQQWFVMKTYSAKKEQRVAKT